MENLNKAVKTNEVSVINVGAGVADGERKLLHVATCDCGCRVYRAAKQESLNYYLNKLTAKCCGSKLHYAGQKLFEGNKMMESPVKEVKKAKKTVNPKWIQPKNDLVKAGPRGITNQGMIKELEKAGDDVTILQQLFDSYPEVFISSAKYMKDSLKETYEKIINANPDFTNVSIKRRKNFKITV